MPSAKFLTHNLSVKGIRWLLCECELVTIFNAIELSSIYFSSTVFHDIFKQIQQHVHICKIFARWHLAIAIIGNIITGEKRVAFQLLNSIVFNLLAISSHLLLQK